MSLAEPSVYDPSSLDPSDPRFYSNSAPSYNAGPSLGVSSLSASGAPISASYHAPAPAVSAPAAPSSFPEPSNPAIFSLDLEEEASSDSSYYAHQVMSQQQLETRKTTSVSYVPPTKELFASKKEYCPPVTASGRAVSTAQFEVFLNDYSAAAASSPSSSVAPVVTSYSILMKLPTAMEGHQRETTVTRTLADFEWLNNNLAKEFVHVILPPLPTSSFDALDSEVERVTRCLTLRSFLRSIRSHPALRNSTALWAFLTTRDEEFAQAKLTIEPEEPPERLTVTIRKLAYSMLQSDIPLSEREPVKLSSLLNSERPYKETYAHDYLNSRIRQFSRFVQNGYRRLNYASSAFTGSQLALADAWDQVGDAFMDLGHSDILLMDVCEAIGGKCNQAAKTIHTWTEQRGMIMTAGCEDNIAMGQSLMTAMARKDDLEVMKEVKESQLRNRKGRLESRQRWLEADDPQILEAQEVVVKATRDLVVANENSSTFSERFWSEFIRWQGVRKIHVKALLSHFSDCEQKNLAAVKQIFSEALLPIEHMPVNQ